VTQDPGFDAVKAHRYFSADCFNKAWELIEKSGRTPEEEEQMILRSQASLWHWTQREDCTEDNLSIGYWQVSRIYAILGRSAEARRYAALCMQHTPQEKPFLLAYAHEAAARAEKSAGNTDQVVEHRAAAVALAGSIDDEEDRNYLMKDLETLL
jgi:hypothetical protein